VTRPTPLGQVVADDLLIDLVAGRQPAGDDPIASLLAALAEHADRPLGRATTGRRFRRHRVLSALAALTVGASGAGVAAAATVPDGTPAAAPALVTRAPHRPASDPGAELVRDASGRVLVVGADGTRFDSAWLPDGVSPVLFTPAGVLGRASGAEASRFRWAALPGSTALLLAGPEQGLAGPDAGAADATPTEEAQQDATTGPIDDAATPVDPAAAPVEQPAPEPSGATTSAATPSDDATTATTPTDDATTATTPSDDATDPSAGADESDATPSGSETTGSADAGKPADTGKPASAGEPGVGRPSGTEDADHLPPQALPGPGVPAIDAPMSTPPASSAPADDGGLVAAPTIPVMVPLSTVPMAVLADPS